METLNESIKSMSKPVVLTEVMMLQRKTKEAMCVVCNVFELVKSFGFTNKN